MRTARKLVVAALLATMLLIPAPARAERTLALSAGSFRFEVSPGEGGRGEVLAINDGDKEMNVLVYVADQRVDEEGNVQFVTPNRDNLQQSLAGPSAWVRLEMPERSKSIGNTPYIVLKPGEEVPVKFSFEVPAETPSGDHNTIVFFEMFSFENSSQGMTSKVQGRVGSRLKIRVKGTIIERLSAAPFSVKPLVTSNVIPFDFTLRNEGNTDERIKASFDLLTRNEESRFSAVVATEAVVYAGSRRRITGDATPEGTLIGPYTARLTIDYEKETGEPGPASIVEERTVWILPMWVAVAAGGGLVLLILWISWRVVMRIARRRIQRERRGRKSRAEAEGRGKEGLADVPGADGIGKRDEAV